MRDGGAIIDHVYGRGDAGSTAAVLPQIPKAAILDATLNRKRGASGVKRR
jgi:hypothetical protein